MLEFQLSEAFHATQVVGGDDVDTLLGQLLEQVDRGLRCIVAPHFAEITMGADNRLSITEMEFGDSHAKG